MHPPRLKSLELCAEATRGAFGYEDRDVSPVTARRRGGRLVFWLALLGLATLVAAHNLGWAGMVATLAFLTGAA